MDTADFDEGMIMFVLLVCLVVPSGDARLHSFMT